MINYLKSLMGIIILMLSPFLVQAQMLDPVSFEISRAPEEIAAGKTFSIEVRAEIDGKWHLYSVANDPDAGPYPTQFTSSNPSLEITGVVQESPPQIAFDPNFNTDLGWHTGQATFTIPLTFSEKASQSTMIDLEVLYQVCDDKSCLPPKRKSVTKAITVTGGMGTAGDATGAKDGPTQLIDLPEEQLADARSAGGMGSDGILSFLWLALTAGFAALLTPCVFPMIPLTVSFFSKQGGGARSGNVLNAFGFGLAIIVTFTILGALLSLLIGASGANRFAANPWVNLSIALVLGLFAMSLLGAFELRLPYRLTNWLNRKSNESSGITGLLFMALTISAVSFSCTAPFVGGVLAATAGGEWFYPIVGMVGFSTAFASPFVLFALFPSWLESLPSSGSWMNSVKVLLGFVELAAAIKFLSNADLVWGWGLISRPFAIAAWIAIFLLAGLYILGLFALRHEEKPKRIGTGRLMVAIPLFLFSFYLVPGLLGASLGIWDAWLPPKQATDVSMVTSISQRTAGAAEPEGELGWSDDYQQSLEQAKAASQPVFVDFTGYTCTNCRAMEANVFPLQPVKKLFGKMEKVRLYTDDGMDGPKNQKFQFQLTGTVALPTYVIVNPYTGQVLGQLVGYSNKEEFQAFLESGLQKFQASRSSAAKIN